MGLCSVLDKNSLDQTSRASTSGSLALESSPRNISGSQEGTDPGSVNRLLRSLRVVTQPQQVHTTPCCCPESSKQHGSLACSFDRGSHCAAASTRYLFAQSLIMFSALCSVAARSQVKLKRILAMIKDRITSEASALIRCSCFCKLPPWALGYLHLGQHLPDDCHCPS